MVGQSGRAGGGSHLGELAAIRIGPQKSEGSTRPSTISSIIIVCVAGRNLLFVGGVVVTESIGQSSAAGCRGRRVYWLVIRDDASHWPPAIG